MALAVRRRRGPKTVIMTTCALPPSTLNEQAPASVVTALGPGVGVYGFASCRTTVPGAIYFFLSRGGRSMHELTPYHGTLEVMASDGTGAVYLCYSVRTAIDTSLYIARRSAQGKYSPPALLTHTVGTFRPSVTLAAANGKWWAVWSEATSTEQFPSHVLFEQRTLLGVRPRHRVTVPGPSHSDWQPALAVSGSLARLAWLRSGLDRFSARPMLASSRPDGTWRVGGAPALSGASVGYPPQMVIDQGRTYLVFHSAVYLDNGTGHFVLAPAVNVYFRPYLAASAGVATIAELATTEAVGHSYLQVDELRGGTWSSVQWLSTDNLDGLQSADGRAIFVMHKQSPWLYLVAEHA